MHFSMRMVRVREKVFRNSGGLRFNVSLSTARLYSLNLSLRRRLVSPIQKL